MYVSINSRAGEDTAESTTRVQSTTLAMAQPNLGAEEITSTNTNK